MYDGKHDTNSAMALLVGILGPHPSDPGSRPNGGDCLKLLLLLLVLLLLLLLLLPLPLPLLLLLLSKWSFRCA